VRVNNIEKDELLASTVALSAALTMSEHKKGVEGKQEQWGENAALLEEGERAYYNI
jgi:hypothetical protein